MVPDLPRLTRRRALGGAAAALAGTVAAGALAPTALPDPLTDAATTHYPAPEVDRWEPEVIEAHATEAVKRLVEVASRGEKLWARLDADPELVVPAGGRLDDAREALEAGNHREALDDATSGLHYAGEHLGKARVRIGDVDPDALVERATALRERLRGVAADVESYPVDRPARDLAWYYPIESELLRARSEVPSDVREWLAEAADTEHQYDPRRFGGLLGSLLQTEQRIRNAERYRDLLDDRIDDGRPHADHIATVHGEIESAIDSLPTQSEARQAARTAGRESRDGSRGPSPYRFARERLVEMCFQKPWLFWERDDLRLYRTVELSRELAHRRAHSVALDRLVVEPGDDGFDAGHALREKRRALRTYRSVLSGAPPLLSVHAHAFPGGVDVDDNAGAPDWRARLKAYLYALADRAKLEQYPAAFRRLIGEESRR